MRINQQQETILIMKVSVVIPTMNEPAIEDVVKDIFTVLKDYDVEVLVVDNSSDDTSERAAKSGATIIRQRGEGYGNAYIMGFKHVEKNSEIVVMLDGDYSYDPHDIPKLLEPIKEGVDFVIGNRFAAMEGGAMSRRNLFGNRILTSLIRFLYHVRISDSQSGMRAITRTALDSLRMKSQNMPFATEMIIEARMEGLEIIEVPIKYRVRIGEAKLNPYRDAINIIYTMVRLVRDYNPIVIFLPVGLILSLIGFGYGIDILIEFIKTGVVTRFAGAILSVLLIVVGLQIMLFGLLADIILTNLRRS
jgi:glycosyltransferase involved in cell wall biosynthesis